jgi:hypothetical protein
MDPQNIPQPESTEPKNNENIIVKPENASIISDASVVPPKQPTTSNQNADATSPSANATPVVSGYSNVSSEQLLESANQSVPNNDIPPVQVGSSFTNQPLVATTVPDKVVTNVSQPQAPISNNPSFSGKDLGVVGLITSFIFAPVGIVLSAISLSKSKKVKHENTPALVGLILGVIFTIFWCFIILLCVISFSGLYKECEQLGPGVHYEGSTTITCGGSNENDNISED